MIHPVSTRSSMPAEVSRLGAGAVMNTIGFGIGSAASFATALVVTHSLGAVDAGHYFQSVALITVICAIASCGAEPGAMRAFAQLRTSDDSGAQRLLAVAVLPVLAVSLAVFAAFEVFASSVASSLPQHHDSTHLLLAVRVIGFAIPAVAIQRVVGGASRGLGSNHGTTFFEGFAQQVIRLLLTVAAAAFGASLFSLTLVWMLPALATTAVMLWWVERLLHQVRRPVASHFAAAPRRVLAREFWTFTWARGVAYSFQVTTLWLGTLLAGWLGSARDAAVFGSLSRLAIVGTLVLQSINLVLAPQLAAALKCGDHSSAERLYQIATGWAVAICFPVFVAIGVYSSTLLQFFGGSYPRGAAALSVVAGAMLWNILTGPVTAVLLMAGRSVWNLWNSIAAFAVYLVVGVFLVPQLGLLGAAVAWAAAILVENGLPLVQVYRSLRLSPWAPPTLRAAATAIGVFGGVGATFRVLGGAPLALVVSGVALSTAIYVQRLRRDAGVLELGALIDRRRPASRIRPAAVDAIAGSE